MSRFRHVAGGCLLTGLLSTLLLCSGSPSALAADGPLSALQDRVTGALAASTAQKVAATIDVAGLGTFGVDSGQEQRPASTQKIFTTTTALLTLGPDFRYATRVFSDGAPIRRDGVLMGDLVVVGSGDPTLTSARLDGLAAALAGAGLRRVAGGLVVDDSRYAHDVVAPGWQPDFLGGEAGQVSAFTVDRNTWTSGAAFDADPTPANLGLWRRALARHGISVAGRDSIGQAPHRLTHQLATDGSAPLRQIVTETLRHSDNFYAEMLLREVGAATSGYGSRGNGIKALGAVAHRLGVPLGQVYDGSGLSYLDRETPTQLVSWLSAAASTPAGPVLTSAMPSSCQTGTLKRRLCGAWLTGRVHAKTGTLDGVRTLSGFTTARSGQRVTFTILLADIGNMSTAMSAIDSAVAQLATFVGPPPARPAAPAPTKAAAPPPAEPAPAPRPSATHHDSGALAPAVASTPLAAAAKAPGDDTPAGAVAAVLLALIGGAIVRYAVLRPLSRERAKT